MRIPRPMWPLLALTLGACVSPPPRVHRVAPATPAPTDVYVYPSQGQGEAQLDRDRYECNTWAVKQTHYDPSQVHDAPQVHVMPASPPGANTVGGVIVGAVVGSLIGGPQHAAGGALVGAAAGGMVGAATDSEQQQQVERVQRRYDARSAQAMQQAQDYRRAISACLEGRGYTVK